MANFEKDINEIFDRYECHYGWSVIGNNVEIEVIWGDWKHDHRYLQYIMSRNHYRVVNRVITEENGDDAFSAEYEFKYGY